MDPNVTRGVLEKLANRLDKLASDYESDSEGKADDAFAAAYSNAARMVRAAKVEVA